MTRPTMKYHKFFLAFVVGGCLLAVVGDAGLCATPDQRLPGK